MLPQPAYTSKWKKKVKGKAIDRMKKRIEDMQEKQNVAQ